METLFTLPLEEQAYLSALLTQPHRHYHNITHVNDCLAEAYKMFNAGVGKEYDRDLTYAIWYHDSIYNPYAPHGINEQMSRDLFEQYHARKGIKFIDNIGYAIKLTASHIKDQTFSHGIMTSEFAK